MDGLSQANKRSQCYTYDELNRLVGTQVGMVSFNGQNDPQVSGVVRADLWHLDHLGNWTGGAATGTTGPPISGTGWTLPSGLPGFGRLTVDGPLATGTPWSARTDDVDARWRSL